MADAATPFDTYVSAYQAERCRHIARRLKRVSKTDDEISIHKARVEIKKEFALGEMIDHCTATMQCHKSLRPLAKIFKLMGILRDHSNAMELCKQYKIDYRIFDNEKRTIKRTRKMLRSKINELHSGRKKINRSISKLLQQIDEPQWESYLHDKRAEINSVLGASPTAEELHAIRRSIRHLLCMAQLCGDDASVLDLADATRLDSLQRGIGEWHDMVVFMTRLRELGYDSSHPHEYAMVKKKEKQLRRAIDK